MDHPPSRLTANGMEVPSLPDVPLRDTNGAGDAYFAGYLYGHTCGYDVLRCMQAFEPELANRLEHGDARLPVEPTADLGNDGRILVGENK